MQIDFNCDMGEGMGNEALLIPFISSANIACGFHAGSETEMRRIVALCLEHNVAIGAHPSFPDKENFGRLEMSFPAGKLRQLIKEQLMTLNEIAVAAGGRLHHVKPHGALYNMAAKDPALAMCIAEAVKDFDDTLIYYGLSGSVMIDEALQSGLRVAHEVFADRTYQADGSLTPRTVAGALINDAGDAVNQVIQMIQNRMVTASNGKNVLIKADTVCIHGDGPHAAEFARQINDKLRKVGFQIKKIA